MNRIQHSTKINGFGNIYNVYSGSKTPNTSKSKVNVLSVSSKLLNKDPYYIKSLCTYRNDVKSSQVFGRVGNIISSKNNNLSKSVSNLKFQQKGELLSSSAPFETSERAAAKDTNASKSPFELSSLLNAKIKQRKELNKTLTSENNKLLNSNFKLSGIMQNDNYLDNLKSMLGREKSVVIELNRFKEHLNKEVSRNNLNINGERFNIKNELNRQNELSQSLNEEKLLNYNLRSKIQSLMTNLEKVNHMIECKTEEYQYELGSRIQRKDDATKRIEQQHNQLMADQDTTYKASIDFGQQIEDLKDKCYSANLVRSDLFKEINNFQKREYQRVKALSIEKKNRYRLHL